jgi:hypothetical protein
MPDNDMFQRWPTYSMDKRTEAQPANSVTGSAE